MGLSIAVSVRVGTALGASDTVQAKRSAMSAILCIGGWYPLLKGAAGVLGKLEGQGPRPGEGLALCRHGWPWGWTGLPLPPVILTVRSRAGPARELMGAPSRLFLQQQAFLLPDVTLLPFLPAAGVLGPFQGRLTSFASRLCVTLRRPFFPRFLPPATQVLR